MRPALVIAQDDDARRVARYRPVRGRGWWDRLRRVDHRIWDALLALVLVLLSILWFELGEARVKIKAAQAAFLERLERTVANERTVWSGPP